MRGCGLAVAKSRLEFTEHDVKQVIGFQLRVERPCRVEAGLRAMHVCERHGAVEGDHGRGVEFLQLVVEGEECAASRSSRNRAPRNGRPAMPACK